MKPNMLQAILSHALAASCAQPWGRVQPATTQQHPASSLAHKLGVSVDELPELKANGNLQFWKGRHQWTISPEGDVTLEFCCEDRTQPLIRVHLPQQLALDPKDYSFVKPDATVDEITLAFAYANVLINLHPNAQAATEYLRAQRAARR